MNDKKPACNGFLRAELRGDKMRVEQKSDENIFRIIRLERTIKKIVLSLRDGNKRQIQRIKFHPVL